MMEITEVRIKLMEDPGERLKAFCSITFDNCFVVRDLKIIEGSSGPFVAMPSRKLTFHCPDCGTKNHLRSQFCNQCGAELSQDRLPLDTDGRAKLYADIAHPINSACREMIQNYVIDEFYQELDRAKQPGYVSRYDDFDIDPQESSRPSGDSRRTRDTRVDEAHSQHKPHGTPKDENGGAARRDDRHNGSSSANLSTSEESTPKGFGAGIFPER